MDEFSRRLAIAEDYRANRMELDVILQEIAERKKKMQEHEKLIAYRNHLQSLAVFMDKNTIEYNNIEKRILFAHCKAYKILHEHFPIHYRG